MNTIELKLEPLTRTAFKPFGNVIETEGAEHFSINAGTVERYHDLAQVDIGVNNNARTLISIAHSKETTSFPLTVPLVERHPLGSQAFFPLSSSPLVVVVTEACESVNPEDLHAFISNGRQGVNYHAGVWHMPLIALEAGQQSLIIDRGGPGNNCDEHYFKDVEVIIHR